MVSPSPSGPENDSSSARNSHPTVPTTVTSNENDASPPAKLKASSFSAISEKLDQDNYLLWCQQVESIIKAHKLHQCRGVVISLVVLSKSGDIGLASEVSCVSVLSILARECNLPKLSKGVFPTFGVALLCVKLYY